jgi:hypothetical protein
LPAHIKDEIQQGLDADVKLWPLGQPLSAQILALKIAEGMFGHLAFLRNLFSTPFVLHFT